ncbi:hypothetical protein XIS1_1600022 [Xenorhabdus innexi]|uniref:Uncharacterized protein n=1 Tax=Xenorhabdus innexi TaxID=290109 RepID=A0A1N6MUX8_9GAMM|nr:hypothetical protein XIS1_1600022 [Xenorhabdus innexi]
MGSLCSTIELHSHQRFDTMKYIPLIESQQLLTNEQVYAFYSITLITIIR